MTDYSQGLDLEAALKTAAGLTRFDGVQVIEGYLEPVSRPWDHEHIVDTIRNQLTNRVAELHCVSGAGELDLPGSLNLYIPDYAVLPKAVARGARRATPADTLLVVEVRADGADRADRYAEYGAPLHLLVDAAGRTVTLHSEPGPNGYARQDGPHRFGDPVPLPQPFSLTLDTSTI
ncbi:Uma2 family endonuclease [Streptomyces sp. NPDC004436]